MPLLERRILEIHSFPHFSLTRFDILSWNFAYDLFYFTTDQVRVSSISVNFCWSYAPFIVGYPRSFALTFKSRGSQRQISRLRECQNREIWLVALRNLTAIFSQSQWTFLTSLRLWTIMSASMPAEWIRHFTGFAVLISGVFGVFRKTHPHKLVDTRLALV